MTYGKEPHNLKYLLKNFTQFRFGYSNIFSVMSYLIRVEPFTSIFVNVNGKMGK